MTNRKTILVLAYSTSPVRGSEYAICWDYITHMSRDHDLIVLYGLAGDHMGDLEEMDGVNLPNVRFVPVKPGSAARILNAPNRRGFFVYSFYLGYRFWHRDAYRIAKAIVEREPVDLVHYLGPTGFREPGILWKLHRPYLWGPIGGMPPYPARLARQLDFRAGVKAAARNVANHLQLFWNPRLRQALRRADALVATTSANAALIKRISGRTATVLPESGPVSVRSRAPIDLSGPLRLIWTGSLDLRKALSILLHALADADYEWSLDVLGEGPQGENLRHLASELGLGERIRFHGKIPRQRVLDMYAQADLHVITSLREGHPTVLTEAMANGVPTVAFDHSGMHDSICDACGIRLEHTSIPQMIASLSDVLRRLARDRQRLQALHDGVGVCAREARWDRRIEHWNGFYDEAVEHFRARGR